MSPRGTRRKVGIRRPYKRFVIVCEGTKTERIYFNRYRKRDSGLKIETPKCKVTDPKNLVKYANGCVNEFDLDFKFGDELWVVFDCDSCTDDQIQKAKKAARKDLKFCFSNPCFEFWYLLHFINYSGRIDTRDTIERLEQYIPGYQKNMEVYDQLEPTRDNAMHRSKDLNRTHSSNGVTLLSAQSNPSTQVFKIVDRIIKLTKT
jgi:hypothetical protein